MNLLALELSTAQSSAALFRDDALAAEFSWNEKTARSEYALHVVPTLLEQAGMSFDDLDLYAVGRGPGNYSGMRVGLTVAQALALPDGKEVYAVSSGEALAGDVLKEGAGSPVAVVGDARRQHLWLGVFGGDASSLECMTDWKLITPDELAAALPDAVSLVSPEWKRLETVLDEPLLAGLPWCRENRYPTARGVGQRVLARIRAGLLSEPLTPIYLHPAV